MKKLLSMLLAGAMLLSSAQMTAMAQKSVPTPEDGVFNIAGFGDSDSVVGSTNTTGYMNALETVVNNEYGAGFAKTTQYGQYNFDYSWSNLENMLRSNSELLLIDTAFFSNNANDGELFEDIILNVAEREKSPYVAAVIPVGTNPAIEEVAQNYGIDVIHLSGAAEATAEGYAEHIFNELTYTKAKIPADGTKIYPTSYPATSFKVLKNITLKDECQIFEADGSSILMSFDEVPAGSRAIVSIDGSKWSDPITGTGLKFSRYHLPNTHHYIAVKVTGTVKIGFISSDRITCNDEAVEEGFEDRSIACLHDTDKSKISVVKGGADGSGYALSVNGVDIKFPAVMEAGKNYQFTAKVKSKTATSIKPILFRYADRFDDVSDSTPPLGGAGYSTLSDLSVTPGEWTTIKAKITPAATMNGSTYAPTKYGYLALRMSDEYLIDDVSFTPYEKADGFRLDFDDLKYGDDPSVGGYKVTYSNRGNYAFVSDGNGGQFMRMPNLSGGHEIVRVSKFYFNISGIYKISFKARANNDAVKGKELCLITDYTQYKNLRKNSIGGDIQSGFNPSANYDYSPSITLGDNWSECSYYFVVTNDMRISDLLGVYADLYFRTCEPGTHSGAAGDPLAIDFDDFIIEEVNVPFASFAPLGKTPSGQTVSFGEDGALNFTNASGDAYFAVPFEHKSKYTISFDIKGVAGMTVAPVIDATMPVYGGNHWPTLTSMTLTGEWQHYTVDFDYSIIGDEVLRHPLMRLRFGGEKGDCSVKNFKYELIKETGIRNIESDELRANGVATIDFDDLAPEGKSHGYAYTIYAKDANGNKVIYKNGTYDMNPIKYYVNAPVGTTLYAKIAANTDGAITKYTEAELGTVVKGIDKCTITCDSIDPGELEGYITVENDKTPRTLNAFIAQYDELGTMLDIKLQKQAIPAYDEETIPVSFEMYSDDVVKIKLFALDENLTPYGEAASIE